MDAAANAACAVAAGSGGGVNGKVTLSMTDTVADQPRGVMGSIKSACKITIFYTNPPDVAGESIGIMGLTSGMMGGSGGAENLTTAVASV